MRTKYSLLVSTLFIFLACSSNPVDQFLDEYENVVKQWESKANRGNISLTDINDLNQASLRLSEKANELKNANEFSSAQLKRYTELSARLSKAFIKISRNKPSVGY